MRAASAATAAAVSFFDSIQNQILLPNLLATTDADVFHPQFLFGMFTGTALTDEIGKNKK
jgi:hypothetical protein